MSLTKQVIYFFIYIEHGFPGMLWDAVTHEVELVTASPWLSGCKDISDNMSLQREVEAKDDSQSFAVKQSSSLITKQENNNRSQTPILSSKNRSYFRYFVRFQPQR